MITAILKAGLLKGKIKTIKVEPEIKIMVPLLGSSLMGDLYSTKPPVSTPRLVFVWKKQVGKYTHEYILKTIDSRFI